MPKNRLRRRTWRQERAGTSATPSTALLFARPLALYRTGRVQSKYANVLSVKRRFDGISAHFVPAVDVVSVPVPVFRCLRWFGLFSLLLLFKFLSSHQVRRHACRLLQISSSSLARHTSISARTARPGRHRSRCWSLIYMHKFCVWFAPVYDALI